MATFKFVSNIESVTSKDWACGSKLPTETNDLIYEENKLKFKSVIYPPALVKMFDEVIVNALDHMISSEKVTYIDILFDQNGMFTITNDGAGIPITIHEEATKYFKKDVYIPTLIFQELYQGSNYNNNTAIVGGTNGIGAKVCNYHSISFNVKVKTNGVLFAQSWKNGIPGDYMILPEKGPNFVEVKFLPNYYELFKYNTISELQPLLSQLIYVRTKLASAYIDFASIKIKPKITYNGNIIKSSLCSLMCDLFDNPQTKSFIISTKNKKYYDMGVDLILSSTLSNFKSICLINGMRALSVQLQKYVFENISNQLKNIVSGSIGELISAKFISKYIFVCINAQFPRNVIGWTGQRKDVLENISNKVINEYSFPIVANSLLPYIESIVKHKKTKVKVKESNFYKPAKFSGTQKSNDCKLLIVEGISAMTQVINAISKHYGWKYYGAYSVQGVIMNVRKECTKLNDFASQSQYKTKSKYQNSKFIKDFNNIIGLNTSYKYDPKSATFKDEINSLKYGCIIACVDQDLDGKGNILGLLVNMIEYFWPNLIDMGFIKWLQTPIVRVYPNNSGKIIEFYSVNEFEKWKSNNQADNIRYYKGLASHNDDESLNMFNNIDNKIITFKRDKDTADIFEGYYGPMTDYRKIEFSTPISDYIDYEDTLSCSEFAKFEIKQYHLDNIHRKLIHVIDGQNQSGRKILDGIMRAFNDKKIMKASELAGYISSELNYHHGDQSLSYSVIGKAFIGVGGVQLPFLLPQSQTGTRFAGGKDCGSPRYVHLQLNKKIVHLLFPREDYYLLNFNYDDGKRVEPKYFVPIIPLALLETHEIPASAWKLQIWARDVFSVINSVKNIISYNLFPVKFDIATYKQTKYEWKGTFRYVRGILHSFGKYSCDKNVITITELPLRMWTNEYMKIINNKLESEDKIIKSIENNSNSIDINIIIKLYPDAMNKLSYYDDSPWSDAIETYFQLRCAMHDFINCVNVDGGVIEFKNYTEIIKPWFDERKRIYQLRVERKQILQEIQLIYIDNTIKYILQSKTQPMATKKKEEMIAILNNQNYQRIDIGTLNNPKFIKNEELKKIILTGNKASYDYLLKLNDIEKSNEALEKLESLKNQPIFKESKEVFPGSSLWLNEINELEKEILTGFKTNWKYGKHYTF